MAKRRLNPRSLAERLDATLLSGPVDRLATDEDPLVDMALRLSASPPPEPISPAAKARIRSQVLIAYRQQVSPGPNAPSRAVSVTRWIAVGIAAMAVLMVGLILAREWSDTLEPSSSITTEPILTDTSPLTPPVSTPEIMTPTVSPLPTTIVIDGVVEAIEANTFTVFGMDIELAPNDPILADIRVGDHVRIEGEAVQRGDTTIIVAVSITITGSHMGAFDQSNAQPRRLQPGVPIVVPPGCKITELSSSNPTLECSEN